MLTNLDKPDHTGVCELSGAYDLWHPLWTSKTEEENRFEEFRH